MHRQCTQTIHTNVYFLQSIFFFFAALCALSCETMKERDERLSLLSEQQSDKNVSVNDDALPAKPFSGEQQVVDLKPEPLTTVVTLTEAFEKVGYGWQQLRVLIICGLCFCTDSIEVGLLSFLQVEAKDTFHLSDVAESTLSSVVFAGQLVGALFWGPFADKYGRKRGAFFPALLVTTAGLASAFSVDFYMLVSLRFLVGVGIGGMGVPFDLLAEFMPAHLRGKALISIEFFWTFGTMFVNGLAWIMLDSLGWRYLIGLCSIPVALAMFSFPFMPESPQWLLSVGRREEAAQVMQTAARLNGRPDALPEHMTLVLSRDEPADGKTYVTDVHLGSPLPPVVTSSPRPTPSSDSTALLADETEEPVSESASPLRLFDQEYRATTLLLWLVWGASGFTYYGTVIIAPEFFSNSNQQDHANSTSTAHFDYPALFTTGAAEVVGCIIAFLLIERVGRKMISGMGYLVCGAFTVLLIAQVPRGLGIAMLMVARGAIFIGTSVTWVLTPELYSTSVRAAGHSWSSAVARLAAFATPYWGDATSIPFWGRLIFYGVMNCIAAIGSFCLPRETRGIALD
eukprot:m.220178 g.220178  ORF g.220178 m.220178 type:complete len:570 (-) comp17006_c2_seq15:199-1908(-)